MNQDYFVDYKTIIPPMFVKKSGESKTQSTAKPDAYVIDTLCANGYTHK